MRLSHLSDRPAVENQLFKDNKPDERSGGGC